MKSLLLMLAVLMAITLWFRHDNLNLSRSFAKANQIAAEQKNTINVLNHQLAVSQRMVRENENAQVRLRDALAVTAEEMARREAAVGRLMNENEELRRWYHAQLPDVVRRLHTRAACASAAHCLQRLPKGERLPDASK
ncbi:Rz-like lysis system protein LysB [Enterobacter cloacae]|uniref:Rz-like lysis system protein LysB n=1 Tax=Enterobacter cloacae TaxID=550 RepID=UPI000668B0BC|nr:Rz-like lysis system protein LysB [Enterobacter cloacae]HAS1005611.1 LysB family phage lysis regulatory protein [Enterobacter cloacae]HAS1145727.1 LysB family phage lysis regulatory protein [Enterobacter cloacae]HAS1177692.1 LysB family phage lysis regulatory protein [Enterobacter cloacae]HAS1196555.1 LysB family phage lysis regulatory protein [Enterobacter cloacae]HDW0665850.1 LysB family phage lysis regulatory protein [Enterobacter cloacae]